MSARGANFARRDLQAVVAVSGDCGGESVYRRRSGVWSSHGNVWVPVTSSYRPWGTSVVRWRAVPPPATVLVAGRLRCPWWRTTTGSLSLAEQLHELTVTGWRSKQYASTGLGWSP